MSLLRASLRSLCKLSAASAGLIAVLTTSYAQTPPPVQLPQVTVQSQPAKKAPAKKAAQQPVPAPAKAPAAPPRATTPVVGYVATQSATGTKTDTPLLLTPQSISVIPKDELTARGVESLTEALRYTPGVTLGTYGSNSIYDAPIIRGFTAPTYIDGLRTPGSVATEVVPRLNAYGVERIEVLRGSSSGLYGQTPPGGLINITSKRPTDTPQNEVGVRFGNFNRFDAFFDFSGPVDPSKTVLYRVVGSGKISDTQVDFLQDNNHYLAPSFTFKFTPDTTLTVLASTQRETGRGYQQYVPGLGSVLPNPNGQIPYSRYVGEPGIDSHRVAYDSIGYAFEHRFDSVFQFRQNLKLSRLEGGINDIAPFGALGADLATVPRAFFQSEQVSRTFAIDNQLQANFTTGSVAHKLLTGVDYYQSSSFNAFNLGFGATSLNVFNPTYSAPQAIFSLPFQNAFSNLKQTGVYVQEQAKLDRWLLTLTGRLDNANLTVGDNLALTTTERNDRATTGRAALSYVFDNGVAPYVSYATNFEPTTGLDRLGATFAPRTGATKEIGIKYQPFAKALFTAAYFDTDQANVLTTDPLNVNFQTQTGGINVKGVEFEGKISVSRNLDVTAAYSHIDPTVTASNDGNVGKAPANIALDHASLWAMYKFWEGPLAGFGIGGGVRYTGQSYGDAANTLKVPNYTIADAAFTYDFGYLSRNFKGFTGQLNVTNIADTYYVTNCFGINNCGLGNARAVLGTMSYKW